MQGRGLPEIFDLHRRSWNDRKSMVRAKSQQGLLAGLAVTAALLGPSCLDQRQAALERDVQSLREEIQELKRSRTEHRARLAELTSKLQLVQDRLESQEASTEQLGFAPGDLPVIRVGPADAAGGRGSYSVIRRSGGAPTERSRPEERAPAAPARQEPAGKRPFSVEHANRAGIDPGERLPAAPLPPPATFAPAPSSADAAASTTGTMGTTPALGGVAGAAAPAPGGSEAPAAAAPPPLPPPAVLASTRPADDPARSLAPGAAARPTLRAPAPGPAPVALAAGAPVPLGQAAPPPPEDDGPPPPPAGNPQQEYQQAYTLYQGGRFSQARQVFERFTTRYPAHDLTDNSFYWMGEISYKQKRFEEALELFSKVIEVFPTGNKVPDAFLKIGLCYLNLGREDAARKILQQVQTIFPESEAARIAISHLKLL